MARLRKLFCIGLLGIALAFGAPMRPEEIEELLYRVSQPKVVHTLRQGEDAEEE